MTSETVKSVLVHIEGKVQRVWFRAWTRETALSLGLDGWVRNRRDGAVEAVFSGPVTAVDAMLGRCHDGPEYARVDSVTVNPYNDPVPPGFVQERTV